MVLKYLIFNEMLQKYIYLKKQKQNKNFLHTANNLIYFKHSFFKKNKYSKFKRKCVLAWIS